MPAPSTVYVYDRYVCITGIVGRSRDRRADKESRAINSANIPDIYRAAMRERSWPRVVRKSQYFSLSRDCSARTREIRAASARAREKREKKNGIAGG